MINIYFTTLISKWILHYFISTVNNFQASQPAPQVQQVVEAVVDPLTTNYGQPENQLNILTEIDRVEAEETSLELEPNLDLAAYSQVEESSDDYITIDEYIKYIDPVGNTFEAPIGTPCAAHDSEPGDDFDFSLSIEDEDDEVAEFEF